MSKPLTLVVMAAGLGSRFGGLKQLKPVGPGGETISEYAVYDAYRAGFSRFVFILKPGTELDFDAAVLSRLPGDLQVETCPQRMDDLPEGLTTPPGRERPWGTAHAVWSARHLVDGPFAVVNADDFYGAEAFTLLAHHLRRFSDTPDLYCMAGYRLSNTVTSYGSVSRGICKVDEKGMLTSIVEHVTIERTPQGIVSHLPEGDLPLVDDTLVSMNAWGLTPQFFPAVEEALRGMFVPGSADLLKNECYLPTIADNQRRDGSARVCVYPTPDRWYGVTYIEDLQGVRDGIRGLVKSGAYPTPLWKGEI